MGGELLIGDQGKVSGYGKVVPDATVFAFAGTCFLEGCRDDKKDFEAEVGGEGLVLGISLP